MTEKERSRAKFEARQAEQRAQQVSKQPMKRRKRALPRQASREEQMGRLIDSGWQAWDDRGDV